MRLKRMSGMTDNKREINWSSPIIHITTTLPKDFKDYIREQGYSYNELIRLGVLMKEGTIPLKDRIEKLELRMDKLSNSITVLMQVIRESKDKIA